MKSMFVVFFLVSLAGHEVLVVTDEVGGYN